MDLEPASWHDGATRGLDEGAESTSEIGVVPTRRGAPAARLGSVVELGVEADRAGWSALFVRGAPGGSSSAGRDLEPVVAAGDGAFGSPARRADPYVLLGALAARSEHLLLGQIGARARDRPASLLAKVVTGLDVCSKGRAVLVLGSRPDDGVSPGRQAQIRLGEDLEVCRALVRVAAPSFAGIYERLDRAFNEPRWPHGSGGLPLGVLVGPSGEEIPLAARFCELALLELGTYSRATPGIVARLCQEIREQGRVAGRTDGSLEPVGVVGLPGANEGLPGDLGERAVECFRACREAGAVGVIFDFGATLPDAELVRALPAALC